MLSWLKTAIEAVLEHTESGEYTKALAWEPLAILFGDGACADFGDLPSDCFAFLKVQVASSLVYQSSDSYEAVEELQTRSILALAVGVAGLHSSRQIKQDLEKIVRPSRWKNGMERWLRAEWEAWAQTQLMVDGCDILSKISLPQVCILT